MFTHVLTFECLAVDSDKASRVALSPLGQRRRGEQPSGLRCTKVEVVAVLQEFRKVKEFRYQFSYILQVLVLALFQLAPTS